jgi:MSHA biogenesis protein MshI
LYRIFKRKGNARGTTSIAFGCEGFSLAHIVQEEGEPPRLQVCEYHACADPSDLEQVLGFAVKANRLEGTRCVCLPRPDSYSLRQIDAPPVRDDELREAARWSIKDLIDFRIEDALVEVFDVPQADANDRSKRVYVVAARRSLIDETVNLVRGAGLRLVAIDIIELALRNLSALLPQDQRGVALMYLGPDISLLTINQGGSLYLSRNMDADLEVLSLTSMGPSEDHKPEDLEEAELMRDGLLLEAQRSLDYYEHQLGQDPVATFFIAPTETPLPELQTHLEQNLPVPVEALIIDPLFECTTALPKKTQARCLPAIGAGLRVERLQS